MVMTCGLKIYKLHPKQLAQGATLEIQRTQHAEAVEQQLLRARARQFNVVSL